MVHIILTKQSYFDSDKFHVGDYYYVKAGNDLAELGVVLCV
jgi:hypothetical protein